MLENQAARQERGPIERQVRLLTNARAALEGAVTHPILPQFVGSRLVPIIRGIQVLPDNEFLEILLQRSSLLYYLKDSASPKIIQQIRTVTEAEARVKNSFFTPDTPEESEKGSVILRERFLAEPTARFFLADLLAEEAAHALRQQQRSIPLLEIKDGALRLAPHKTKRELMDFVGKLRRALLGTIPPASETDIISLQRGFRTDFAERQTDGKIKIIFPTERVQAFYEEARAAIIQTVFEALMYAARFAPYGAPDVQLRQGLGILAQNTEAEPLLFSRERGGLIFLAGYLHEPNPHLKVTLAELFEQLATMNLDQFYKKVLLPRKLEEAFDETVQSVRTEASIPS